MLIGAIWRLRVTPQGLKFPQDEVALPRKLLQSVELTCSLRGILHQHLL
jgi:hypothetical protein